MSDQSENPDEQDFPTIPPRSGGPDDEATLPPDATPDALGASAAEDLDTLPQQETNWRPGGTIRYFGDYELISEIARGGMGVVYRAKQTSLNRIVALKMILAGQLAGEEEVQRFHAEAEAAANLDHPGIVPIYEVGEVEGQHYFSMGYVDGSSLSELIAEKPLEPGDAAELTLKVANAIAYAHEQGVIHRDLKPANVLVQHPTGNGPSSTASRSAVAPSHSDISGWSPRVTDFGLAKQVQGDDQLTASGQILGTPSYMPPEQAAGKTDAIDHRADIYSLGGILYALITGRPPFQAANQLDTLMQVLEKDPVPPRQLDPQLPRDIETIALKALEKDPKRRYQTAAEFAEDLARFLNGEPIKARSITSVERAWRWAKRKPVIAGLGALAASLLLIVSIGGPVAAVTQANLRGIAEQRKEQAVEAKIAAQQAAEKETAAKQQAIAANDALSEEKEKAERTLYARTISLAYQAWQDDNVSHAEDLLNQANHLYRDWEWDFINKLCHSEHKTLRGHTGIPFKMRLSKDGKRMVSIGRVHGVPAGVIDVSVLLWDVETGNAIKKLPYRGFAISPDAKYAAVEKVSDGPVVILDVQSGQDVISLQSHQGGTAWANFNSDGTRLVTTGPDKTIRIFDTASGDEVLQIVDEARRLVHDVNFSPDDKLLVWKTFDGFIQIRDAKTGDKVIDIEDRIYRNDAVGVAISPDNQILAASSNGPINFFDLNTGEKIASLFGHRSSVLDLCFSPDGKRLASCGVDGTVRVWNVAERRESFRFRGHKFGTVYGVWEVTYSNDGNWILSGGSDATIKIWPADGGDGFVREQALANADDVDIVEAALVYPEPSQEKDWLVGNTDYVESVVFSPDGKLAATACKDDSVRIFDTQTRELIHELHGHQQDVAAVAFSPDGKLLASGEGGINDNRNGKIFLWDLATQEKIAELHGHGGPIADLMFDPTGQIVYSAAGSQTVSHRGEVFAWKIEEEATEFRYEDIGGVTDMALSPDGTMLAIASYTQPIHLIDTGDGTLIKKIGTANQICTAVEFSPDGKRLAVGTNQWGVGVWDLNTGQPMWEQFKHSGAVFGVAFASSGKRIVSVAIDTSTRIWDAESGDMLVALRGDSMQLFGVSVSPDGNTIACYGEAPYVTIRDLDAKTKSLTTKASAEQWAVIYQDDFDRDELGQQYTIANGSWTIEDGAAKGTLNLMPSIPIPNFAAATLIPQAWLPSRVEIEFDAWAPSGLLFETKLHDETVVNGIGSLFVAMQQPYFNQTHEGGSAIVQAASGFSEVARTGPQQWYRPMQKFKLRTIRNGGRLESFVDGKPMLQAEVPESMWVPALHIQGSFAKPGDVLYIDNLVIRAPASTADEIEATNLEFILRQELKLKSLVIDSIQSKPDISDSVRELALRYAQLHKEDAAARKQVIQTLLADDDTQLADYTPIIDLLKQDLADADEAWQYQQLLAIAYYRSGESQQSLQALKQAETQYRASTLFSHPVHMALLTLVSAEMGNQQRTRIALDRLRELMRSDYWRAQPEAVTWTDKATQAITPADPQDPDRAAEIEAIKALTFEHQWRARSRFDVQSFLDSYTDDAIHIEGRSAQPNQYDCRVTHDQWVKTQTIFSSGAPSLWEQLIRHRADVTIDGDEATLNGEYVWAIPFGGWRYESDMKLRRVGGQWKIYEDRNGVTGVRINQQIQVNLPGDWALRDQEVANAPDPTNYGDLMQRFSAAGRFQEALDAGLKHAQQGDHPANFWADLSVTALSAVNPDVMLESAKKAVKLNPGIQHASYIRSFAVSEHLPEQAADLGRGIRVRMPEFVPEAPTRDFNVPGEVLRAWYPSNRSAVVVFYAENANDNESLETGMEQLAEAMKQNLKATIYRTELMTVVGRQATDLIVEGAGSGRGMSKTMGEAKGTIQRWVVTTRGKDLIGFLLTAHSNEFDQRNSEFATWLEHVEIDAE